MELLRLAARSLGFNSWSTNPEEARSGREMDGSRRGRWEHEGGQTVMPGRCDEAVTVTCGTLAGVVTLGACALRCLACQKDCRYVSYSKQTNECALFRRCEITHLMKGAGYQTATVAKTTASLWDSAALSRVDRAGYRGFQLPNASRRSAAIHSKAIPAPGCDLKVLVNTNVHYGKALDICLKSMEDSEQEFNMACVIVVQGGAEFESISTHARGYTFVTTSDNAFDMHGYNQLFKYRDHPSVRATRYLYLHDTSTVRHGFMQKVSALRLKPGEIKAAPAPSANMVLMHRSVIMNYTDHFAGNLTKQQALRMEHGQVMRKFGTLTLLRPRRLVGVRDAYGTGRFRRMFLYPDFNVVKYVFTGRNGDMTNNVQFNCPPLVENGTGRSRVPWAAKAACYMTPCEKPRCEDDAERSVK